METESQAVPIELRVEDVAQLFDTLDPFPFRDRDLDKEAEEYIVGWARELPQAVSIRIRVHLPESEAKSKAALEIGDAFGRFFAYRAGVIGRELNELIRTGRRSLTIGVSILAICLTLSQLAGTYFAEASVRRLIEESFLILGWVANWRSLEIFLYDWWPIARRRDLYQRLSRANVELAPYRSDEPAARSGAWHRTCARCGADVAE